MPASIVLMSIVDGLLFDDTQDGAASPASMAVPAAAEEKHIGVVTKSVARGIPRRMFELVDAVGPILSFFPVVTVRASSHATASRTRATIHMTIRPAAELHDGNTKEPPSE